MQNLQSHNIVKHCLCTNSEYNNCDIYMALNIDNSNSKKTENCTTCDSIMSDRINFLYEPLWLVYENSFQDEEVKIDFFKLEIFIEKERYKFICGQCSI
jgi:hypothetical protein